MKRPLRSSPDVLQISPEIKRVADGIGRFIEYWGFKAVHGRIWTLLYLSAEPLSAIQLARTLRVSKTLLSFSISELLQYNVIQEAGRGPKRTIYFRANPQINSVIFNVLKQRETPLIKEIEASVLDLKAGVERDTSTSPSRQGFQVNGTGLEDLSRLVGAARAVLESLSWDSLEPEDLAVQFMMISMALKARS